MKIVVYPRIHLTLISLHAKGYRRNGGLGLSVDSPAATVTVTPSSTFIISDKRRHPLTDSEQIQLIKRLEQLKTKYNLHSGASIEISGKMLTHFGMGSGTAIRLASIESYALQSKLNLSRNDLVTLSGRGGTSGVGINTYFDGGYVFDLGVPGDGTGFRPSSASKLKQQPLVLSRSAFPNWKLGLCIPTSINPKSQDDEIDFFSKNTPTREDETKCAAYHCLFGVHASILENSYNAFCKSIVSLQSTTWKALEREQYGQELRELESALYHSGADCVGMSSLGPLLYFFASDTNAQNIAEYMNGYRCEIVLTSSTNNGRIVTGLQNA